VAAETVMTQIPHPYNLGDKGYISQKLQKKLYEEHRVAFLDARSKKSANSPIRRMETVDETKTQSD
jgi:hypothetical protein